MAVKFTSVECPSCGAHLSVEEGREKIFCEYCGTQIIVTNENEHTYRQVDEAAIKRAETERMVRLKELELQEKENERRRKGEKVAFTIAGAMALVGVISEIIVPYNVLGIFIIMAAILVACLSTGLNHEEKTSRIISTDELQMTEDMASCEGENYQTVAALFRSAGFSNVQAVAMKDLNFLTARRNGQVESVSINGSTDFDEGDIFRKNSRVVITYHSTK